MGCRLRLKWLLSLLTLLLAVAAASPSATAEKFYRVLIVYENESTQTAAAELARGLHGALNENSPTQFEIYSEYLDNARFPGADNLDRMADHLAAKYRNLPLDLTIAMGSYALRFMLERRAAIVPGVPLLFGAVGQTTLVGIDVPPDVRGVVSHYDIRKALDLARQLHPDATKVVVVTGAAEFDEEWARRAREAFGDSYDGFAMTYLTGLSLDGFMQASRALPKDAVVLLLTIYEDADGRKFVPRDAAGKVALASSAPAYSVYDSFVGGGVTGSYADTFVGVGQSVAVLARKVMDGEANLPQFVESEPHPILDWRQVMRWGIPSGRIPADAEIRFRTPSVWDDYKEAIAAALTLILLQAGLIAALVFQARRRRRAEEEVALGRAELTHLSRATLLGELSGAFAHELNQPLTAILANAEVGSRVLARTDPDLNELREILSEIAADDRRAANVIAQLRRLLVKGEAALEPVDLDQVVAATLALTRSELLARETKVDFRKSAENITVHGNFAQLQQVVLNLIVNAADATSKLPPQSRAIEVAVSHGGNGHCELAVSDNGTGVTPEMAEDAFKPFVSTKAGGLGLGLAICRSIAMAHGGTLRFDAHFKRGARIVLTLPVAAAHG